MKSALTIITSEIAPHLYLVSVKSLIDLVLFAREWSKISLTLVMNLTKFIIILTKIQLISKIELKLRGPFQNVL